MKTGPQASIFFPTSPQNSFSPPAFPSFSLEFLPSSKKVAAFAPVRILPHFPGFKAAVRTTAQFDRIAARGADEVTPRRLIEADPADVHA